MWGIRAIRVAWVLGGLLALVASCGCCCDGCKKVSGTKSEPIEWDPVSGHFTGDFPEHLTFERIHGGIQ